MPKYYLHILLAGILLSTGLSAKDIHVGPNGDYRSIAAAIAKADSGDVIVVAPGIYREGALVIDKPVSIQGMNWPVIDGQSKYQQMLVTANHVSVSGFKFINSGRANITDISAIRFQSVTACRIADSYFENNYFSIYFSNSNHCLAENNHVRGYFSDEDNSGNGIHLWKCQHMTIRGNSISGHRDGIYFEFVKNSEVENNYSYHNVRYGLHFMFSDGNRYEHNTFRENGSGVAVMYTHYIIMRHNAFLHNWGPAAYGLLLKDINSSVVEDNTFEENTTGIYMEESGKLQVKNNDFKSNGWAMKIMANCTEDTITRNNFMDNTFDVSTNSTSNNNWFQGNFWDKYRGYDLDKNHIGDVPYRPVSLFSTVIEQIPNSVMLLRSAISDILDQVEKVAPSVIPESLEDNQPLMHQIQRKRPNPTPLHTTAQSKGRSSHSGKLSQGSIALRPDEPILQSDDQV